MKILSLLNGSVPRTKSTSCLVNSYIEILNRTAPHTGQSFFSSSSSSEDTQGEDQSAEIEAFSSQRITSINKSMRLYLEKARANDEFMAKEIREFESGKRHLANMMSLDANEMTQEDIDSAISYLFPSGLFDKRARPVMKHPSLIYKKTTQAQFNDEGRPHHSLFYTASPRYYEVLHNLSTQLEACKEREDDQLAHGITSPLSSEGYNFSGKQWISMKDLGEMLQEDTNEFKYDYLIRSLNLLKDHPYSNLAKNFIDKYTRTMVGQSLSLELPKLEKTKEHRTYVSVESKQRELVLKVTTMFDGTGKFNIMGRDVLQFEDLSQREALLFPLQISGMLDKVDIEAVPIRTPKLVGNSQIAMSVRYGVSMAIASYTDDATREKMRLAGLLTHDIRTRERKKFGQEGSRRKYTWRKR